MTRGTIICGTAALAMFALGLWVLIGQYNINEECESFVRTEDGLQCTDYDLVDNRDPLRERIINAVIFWVVSGFLALGAFAYSKKTNGHRRRNRFE